MPKEKIRRNYFLVVTTGLVLPVMVTVWAVRLRNEVGKPSLSREDHTQEISSIGYEGLPADFPIYPGAEFVTSAVSDDTKGRTFMWKTEDDTNQVFQSMKSELRTKGWTISNDSSLGDFLSLSFKKDEIEGFAGVFKGENSKSVISVSIREP